MVSHYEMLKGFTIAYNTTRNCIVENVISSGHGDIIVGNNYKNQIRAINVDDNVISLVVMIGSSPLNHIGYQARFETGMLDKHR